MLASVSPATAYSSTDVQSKLVETCRQGLNKTALDQFKQSLTSQLEKIKKTISNDPEIIQNFITVNLINRILGKSPKETDKAYLTNTESFKCAISELATFLSNSMKD